MSGPGRILLDLRDLPPPRPLEVALEEVDRLPRGACLHLVLVHRPVPLLAMLQARGVEFRCREVREGEAHVLCWRKGDAAAERVAASEPA